MALENREIIYKDETVGVECEAIVVSYVSKIGVTIVDKKNPKFKWLCIKGSKSKLGKVSKPGYRKLMDKVMAEVYRGIINKRVDFASINDILLNHGCFCDIGAGEEGAYGCAFK